MKCSVCGRKLKSPKSQKVGCGPVCYKRIFGSKLQFGNKGGPSSDAEVNYNIPGQISIDDYLQMLQK